MISQRVGRNWGVQMCSALLDEWVSDTQHWANVGWWEVDCCVKTSRAGCTAFIVQPAAG